MSVELQIDVERWCEQLEIKFLRLLEMDRDSAEFEALYEEVDRELGVVAGSSQGAPVHRA